MRREHARDDVGVTGWWLLVLVVLLSIYFAATAGAQTYTLRVDELVVTGLPTKATETDCVWVDAGGRTKRGACSTAGLAAAAANQVFAGPTSGGSALPTFRALVDGDIPNDLTLGTISGTPTFTGAATFNSTVQADISLGAISGRRRWQTNGLGLAALAADNGWAAVSTGPLAVTGTASVSGDLSVGGVSSSLVPSLTDTYNLGSALRLWNEGFVSQLNAVIYAEQTATLFGGWSVIGKNAGTFAAAVGAADTSINFGKAMTNGHFIVVRAHDTSGTVRAEHMQITGTTGCTTCTVTRGLNTGGTGYAFAQGTSYLVGGTTGDGRIELRAYSTPQISVVEQGGTYNAQTERVRIGYLDGAAGMGATTGKVGIVIGDASQYLRYYDGVLTIAGNGAGLTAIDGAGITTGTISADRIAAGSITASKLNVTATGENFTADGSFEYGRTAWGCYDNSGTQTTHCGRWTETTENAVRYGKTMWVVNWNSSSETKGVLGPLMPRGWMPNKPYTVAFWARHNGLTNATAMRLAWNVAPTYGVGVSNPNLSGTWQRYVFHIAWGASVEGGGYGYITINQTVQSGAGGLWIDGLQVFAGHLDPELIGYTEAAQDVPDGTIVANMVAANAITADKIEANALNGKTITGGTLRTGSGGTPDGAVNISNSGIVLGTATGYTSAARVSLNGMGYLYGTSAGSRWNGQGGDIEILAENVGGAVKLGAPQGVQTVKHLFPGYATGTYQNTYGLYRSSTIATGLAINGDLELAGIYKTGGAWLANGGTTTLCDNSGWIYRCNASSRRYKTHIVPAPLDRRVLDLQPVRFDYREPNPVTGEPLPRSLGLIAEDVDALGLRDLVTYQDGQPEAVQYDKLALYLLEVVKDQQRRIEALEAKLKE